MPTMFARRICPVVLAALIFGLYSSPSHAEPTAEQRLELLKIKVLLRQAKRATNQDTSVELVSEAQTRLSESLKAGDPELLKLASSARRQLGAVRKLLESRGAELPAMPQIEAVRPATSPQPQPQTDPNTVSFTGQVAPLLVAKCGKCHVDDAKGKVSMASFADLMRGSPDAGVVVMPGKGQGSRIAEVIESGDMPRGGGKVSPAELELLVRWINQGAKFDGQNARAPLRTLAMAVRADTPAIQVAKATGDETVSFALDVAPVLAEQCSGCHGPMQPRAALDMNTFTGLLKGGDSGPPVMPGKPADSLLVKKLKGLAGDRMPLDRPPLSDDVIAKIETWIAEGARFDGENAALPLARVAGLAFAKTATPEQLNARRSDAAALQWRLAVPDATAVQKETEHFTLWGNVGEDRLTKIGSLAETQIPRVAAALNIPAAELTGRGRITLYVFANRYDYSEFGTMVEKRDLPSSSRGHSSYDPVAPYLVIVPPRNDEYSTDALVAQQLASLFAARHGDIPTWLVEGTGRAVAAGIAGDDPRVGAWDARVAEVLSRPGSVADFFQGKLSVRDANALGYSFTTFLMSSKPNFAKLLAFLGDGVPLDKSLAEAYGASPSAIAQNWARRAGK